jgi:hypothetical protein
MKKTILAKTISASLLLMSSASDSYAHDALNGTLNGTNGVDVLTTQCFAWGGNVNGGNIGLGTSAATNGGTSTILSGVTNTPDWGNGATPTYGPTPAGDVAGPNAGMRFAVSLVSGSKVIANVHFTPTANLLPPNAANSYGNNVVSLAYPLPYGVSVSDTTTHATYAPSGTPEFAGTNQTAPAGFVGSYILAANAPWASALPTVTVNVGTNTQSAVSGVGRYTIALTNSNAGSVSYDWLAHCVSATTGNISNVHTGQGDWLSDDGTGNYAPNEDYHFAVDN